MSTRNRFAVLDDSDGEDVEISAPVVEKESDTFVVVVDESGSWEKPMGRNLRKAAVFAARKAEKKLHAACMNELLIRVQMRMLYGVLVQEWKEYYPNYHEPGYAPPKRAASLKHVLHFRAQSLGALCTAPPKVVPLTEERRVGGYCESCAEYATVQTGWTIRASVAIAKVSEFLTVVQTGFLPELRRWQLVGTNLSLKSAMVSMEPVSLLTLGPSGEVVPMAIHLRFEMDCPAPPRCKSSKDSMCSCREPRGCGWVDCNCASCDYVREAREAFYAERRWSRDEDTNQMGFGPKHLQKCALEFIRRFVVFVARRHHR